MSCYGSSTTAFGHSDRLTRLRRCRWWLLTYSRRMTVDPGVPAFNWLSDYEGSGPLWNGNPSSYPYWRDMTMRSGIRFSNLPTCDPGHGLS